MATIHTHRRSVHAGGPHTRAVPGGYSAAETGLSPSDDVTVTAGHGPTLRPGVCAAAAHGQKAEPATEQSGTCDHVPCTAVDDTANNHGTGLRIYCTFYGYFRVYAPNLLKKTLCRKTGHHVRGGSLTPLVGTAALRDVVFPYA